MGISDLIAPKKQVVISDGIKSVKLDVSVEETHTGESDVTEYAVEEGSNISDNSRPKPRELTIHGFVTSAPLSLDAYTTVPGLKPLRGKNVWEKLDGWRRTGERLRVETSFFRYTNLVLKSITVPRNAKNSDGVEFNLVFRQVFTASTKLVAKPVRSRNVPGQGLGKKITEGADPSLDAGGKGVLESASDAVGGFVNRLL